MGRHRREQDHYARQAKQQGHPARSIFKLEEIDRRHHVLKRGDRVLDLGCAPGSWMQYAARVVGPTGRVIGYDLQPIRISLPPNAEARIGDVFELTEADVSADGPWDVVLSDMAPSTMGHHATDAARSAALVESALSIAERFSKPGANVVLKVLEGRDLPEIVNQMRVRYEKVQRLRPKATRKGSTEVFLIGLGLRGNRPSQQAEEARQPDGT